MARKTERLYANAHLDGTSIVTTEASFHLALLNLVAQAATEDREVLFDTLSLSVESDTYGDSSLMVTSPNVVHTYTMIEVSAEAVKL